MNATKVCRQCGIEQPIESFYVHPKMADGRLNHCKTCVKARVSGHRADNVERIREYDRLRAKHPERAKASTAQAHKWRSEDKRRMAAHNAVTRAIRSGKLIRQPCVRCGRADSYAHHESYDRKLDVVWLCQPCHKVRHREMAIAGIEP